MGKYQKIMSPCFWTSRMRILWIDSISHSNFIGWGEVGAEDIFDSPSLLSFQHYCAKSDWSN